MTLLDVPMSTVKILSFSKLKLMKINLSSSMLQEKLNSLAILSIDKDILKNIDVDIIINYFVLRNA